MKLYQDYSLNIAFSFSYSPEYAVCEKFIGQIKYKLSKSNDLPYIKFGEESGDNLIFRCVLEISPNLILRMWKSMLKSIIEEMIAVEY
jgi:hypothetical protein